jgi:peptidyl-prolyl cis-trans isomerase SurA
MSLRIALPLLLVMAAAPMAPAIAQTPAARTPAAAQTLDRVAATVNDEVVLESEVWDQVQQILSRAQGQPDSAAIDTLRRQVLDNLISMKVVYAEARKAGVSVSDAEIDRYVDQAIDGKRQEVGGDEALVEALRRENLTLEQLRRQYRDQLRIEVVSDRYRERQVPRPRVTQAEAEAYFTAHPDKFPRKSPEYRLAVIQVPVTVDSVTDAAARTAAAAARKRIAGGEKFAKVAAELSDDPSSARSGGDLGFFTRGTTVPEFEKVAFTQRIGVVSDPVRTPFGWHLIEVLERDTLKARSGRDSLDAQGRPLLEAHVRHLLIRVDPGQKDVDRTEGLVKGVRDRATRGEDFGALAKRYSRYAGPQSEGGEIGWVPAESLSPNIREVLDRLSPGEITEPVPTPANPTGVSFNLFKLLEEKPERAYTLDEVREQLPEVVGRIQYNEKVEAWLKNLRSKATIDIKS